MNNFSNLQKMVLGHVGGQQNALYSSGAYGSRQPMAGAGSAGPLRTPPQGGAQAISQPSSGGQLRSDYKMPSQITQSQGGLMPPMKGAVQPRPSPPMQGPRVRPMEQFGMGRMNALSGWGR